MLWSSEADSGCTESCTERVRTTTLDDFFAAQRLRGAYRVLIDTEGSDALVLEGMAQVREAKRSPNTEVQRTSTSTTTSARNQRAKPKAQSRRKRRCCSLKPPQG